MERSDPYTPAGSKRAKAIRLVVGTVALILYGAGFFACAGRAGWIEGWVFIVLLACGQSLVFVYLRRRNPDVLKYRARLGKGTKRWDKLWLFGFVVLYLSILCTAAWDGGRQEEGGMPSGFWAAGAALYLVFTALITWAMAANPHFEKTVRIQHDRGHKVIDSGPYRFVRHPGYTACIFAYFLAPPFLLRSWWAFVPAGITTGWIVIRTVLEDRTLRMELDGYEAYAKRVRYRLIPWIW